MTERCSQWVDLVQHQQGAMTPELRQVQVGRCRDRLVGGDIALQATAWVGSVVRRPHAHRVVQRAAPDRVGEGFLRLQAEAVARDHPADALDDAGCDQFSGGKHGSRDLPPPGVTAARMSVTSAASPPAMACTIAAVWA